MLRLADAKVIFADYDALRRDFRFLRSDALLRSYAGLANIDAGKRSQIERRLIDSWLLCHTGIISEPQAAQSVVNTMISTTDRDLIAYRPPRYGRSIIVEVATTNASNGYHTEHDKTGSKGNEGLLDVKGIGVRAGTQPVATDHSYGLLCLDHLLRELLNQMLLEAVFRHARTRLRALPVYAAIDTGFDCREQLTGSGLIRPAGILVRRAHQRYWCGVEVPSRGSVEQFACAQIEMLLRLYGITSVSNGSTFELLENTEDRSINAFVRGRQMTGYSQEQLRTIWRLGGDGRWSRFGGVNIQTTRAVSVRPLVAELVDFGHFNVRESFDIPLVSLVRGRPLQWGGVIKPGSPGYVQPDPSRQIQLKFWGEKLISRRAARLTGLAANCIIPRSTELIMTLVSLWRRSEIEGDQILAALKAHVCKATSHWL